MVHSVNLRASLLLDRQERRDTPPFTEADEYRIFPARHGVMNRAEKADTLAVLPGIHNKGKLKGAEDMSRSKIWEQVEYLDVDKVFFSKQIFDLFGVKDSFLIDFQKSWVAEFLYKYSLTSKISIYNQVTGIDNGKIGVKKCIFSYSYDFDPVGIRVTNPVFLRDEILPAFNTYQAQLPEIKDKPEIKDEIASGKRRTSYLKIIAALASKNRPIDLRDTGTVSAIKTEIEKIGFELGEDTIRKIVKEVLELEEVNTRN